MEQQLSCSTESPTTRVLITDPLPVVREGLKQMLRAAPEVEVIGTVASGTETVERVHTTGVDTLITSLVLPDRCGLDVIATIRYGCPETSVLALLDDLTGGCARQAIRAGAHGCLPLGVTGEDLVEAVRTVVRGERYVPVALGQALMISLEEPECAPHESLSTREFQIFQLSVAGHRTPEIARRLALSQSTVRSYRVRLLEKMGFQDQTELIRYAVECGLISPSRQAPRSSLGTPTHLGGADDVGSRAAENGIGRRCPSGLWTGCPQQKQRSCDVRAPRLCGYT